MSAMRAQVVKARRILLRRTPSRRSRPVAYYRNAQETSAPTQKPRRYAQPPQLAAEKLQGSADVVDSHISRDSQGLKPKAEIRLGLGRYKVSSTDSRNGYKSFSPRLEHYQQVPHEVGLTLAFKVSQWLARSQPSVSITSQLRPVCSVTAHDVPLSAIWLFTINGASYDDPYVYPLLVNMSIRGMTTRYKHTTAPMVLDLFIYVRQTSDPSSYVETEPILLADLELLCDSALEISRRVCSHLVFETRKEVPVAICEALLSLLSLASPNGEVGKVFARCVYREGTPYETAKPATVTRPLSGYNLANGRACIARSVLFGVEKQESKLPSSEGMENLSDGDNQINTLEIGCPLDNTVEVRESSEDDRLRLGQGISAKSTDRSGSSRACLPNSDSKEESFSSGLPSAPTKIAANMTKSHYGGVYIALGSNVGDRIEAIESACRTIDADPDMKLLSVSPLYETEAMYVEDQAPFLNGVCEIETQLDPMELLDKLQAIEQNLGRVKLIDKGPRNIDLDILLYRHRVVQTERLTIPHALMLEREFVLRPLSHIFGHSDRLVPTSDARLAEHLAQLSPQAMYTVTALSNDNLRLMKDTCPTLTMAILNTTPDSFSDGGDNRPSEFDTMRETVAAQIAAGATIIDVGGQSSRPNAPDITAEEEIARVVPVIRAIKPLTDNEHILISVDTYRASVAEAAVKAGAHIVNDISAGQLDPAMLSTVARLGCTYIMMHMRGTPATMQRSENCSYPHGLLATIRKELLGRVAAAEATGVFPWRIILDPGIGFSKTKNQNLELLTGMGALRDDEAARRYAWLVGSSRKGFIGEVTGVSVPKERVMGTAVTVAAAIMGGADIIRVHDVAEMVQVAKMADAMYRTR